VIFIKKLDQDKSFKNTDQSKKTKTEKMKKETLLSTLFKNLRSTPDLLTKLTVILKRSSKGQKNNKISFPILFQFTQNISLYQK